MSGIELAASAAPTAAGLAGPLFTPVQRRVLGLLFGQPDRRFQSAEIIRLAASGTGAVHRLLQKLAAAGLVNATRDGNQKYYQANREAPIFEELHGLMVKTVGVVEPLRVALEPLASRIAAAFVFGSVAKGSDRATSDLDLLVIADGLDYSDLYAALQGTEQQLARPVNPTLMSRTEWRRKRGERDSFAARIAAQSKLFVIGGEDDLGSSRRSSRTDSDSRMSTAPRPQAVVIAGPNGAGKTTAAPQLLQAGVGIEAFVNADVIAQGLAGFRPGSAAVEAGRIMLQRLDELAEEGADFAFESTLSGRSVRTRILDLTARGYGVHLWYLWLPSPEMAVERVRRRVQSGGHDVPEPVIRRRFWRSLMNFERIYRPIVSSWRLYDGSRLPQLPLVAHGTSGDVPTIVDPQVWRFLHHQAEENP